MTGGGICGICGTPYNLVRRGQDLWRVHETNSKVQCPPFEGCNIATGRHVLEDGSLCKDPRHKE